MVLYSNLTKKLQDYVFEDSEEKDDTNVILESIKAKLVKRKKYSRSGEFGGLVVGKYTYFLRVQPSAQNHNLAADVIAFSSRQYTKC